MSLSYFLISNAAHVFQHNNLTTSQCKAHLAADPTLSSGQSSAFGHSSFTSGAALFFTCQFPAVPAFAFTNVGCSICWRWLGGGLLLLRLPKRLARLLEEAMADDKDAGCL